MSDDERSTYWERYAEESEAAQQQKISIRAMLLPPMVWVLTYVFGAIICSALVQFTFYGVYGLTHDVKIEPTREAAIFFAVIGPQYVLTLLNTCFLGAFFGQLFEARCVHVGEDFKQRLRSFGWNIGLFAWLAFIALTLRYRGSEFTELIPYFPNWIVAGALNAPFALLGCYVSGLLSRRVREKQNAA